VRELKENQVEFEAMRSGGPGGQHGDRRATAVRLRVKISDLPLTDEKKEFLREYLPPKNKTKDNELIVQCGEHRSQKQNRKEALRLAQDEIEKAIQAGRQERDKKKHKRRYRKKGGGSGGDQEDIHEKQKKQRRAETTDDLLKEAYEQDPENMDRYFEENESDDSDK
jgi:ribosome-associated protein